MTIETGNAARAPILRGRGLEFDYPGALHALAGADLSLAPGEVVVVIGPNGSGKSTLLKVLSGLLRPRAGTVELDGVALSSVEPRARARRIAVVPQFLPVLPDVLVADFVAGGRYAHRGEAPRALVESLVGRAPGPEDRAAVARALADCDAADLACRSLIELSGGQRQRVLVARAVAQDAAVWLVDEPTNALDPDHQLRVLDLIAGLVSAGGRAACVVTHDLNLASQYATRIALMDRGRVVTTGTPREVLRPDVLGPVYGTRLVYGEWPDAPHGAAPFVLPRRGS